MVTKYLYICYITSAQIAFEFPNLLIQNTNLKLNDATIIITARPWHHILTTLLNVLFESVGGEARIQSNQTVYIIMSDKVCCKWEKPKSLSWESQFAIASL